MAEHLAARYRMPKWQFTSSATQANIEVIRLAREMTGRETVLVFDGKYHGELDATLVILEDGRVVPESRGLPGWVSGQTRVDLVQRRRGSARGAGAGRRRRRPRRAGDDQRRIPASARRLPRLSCAA